MNTIKITPLKAMEVLVRESANGKIFFAEFKKKDGNLRRMTARKGVSKGVKGVGMAYSPLAKGLLGVFDMDKAEFRMVNLKGLSRFSVNGQKYKVIPIDTMMVQDIQNEMGY